MFFIPVGSRHISFAVDHVLLMLPSTGQQLWRLCLLGKNRPGSGEEWLWRESFERGWNPKVPNHSQLSGRKSRLTLNDLYTETTNFQGKIYFLFGSVISITLLKHLIVNNCCKLFYDKTSFKSQKYIVLL
jgi:hypothetical protein